MISGYCRDGHVSLAVKFFHKMSDYGCTPDSVTYGALISGLCTESKLSEASQLYETMIDKGLSPCEVTRLTLAYEYCKQGDAASAMIILERLEKKLWIRTVNTLIRKLCSEKKVGVAALFFHKLLDKDPNVDRITLAAFTTACYDSNKYALVSDLSEKMISKGIATGFKGGFGTSSFMAGEDYGMLAKSVLPNHVRVAKPVRLAAMMKNVNEGKGLFAPIVVVTRNIIGKKRLNQLRGKAIALHSQVITEFCKSIGADSKQRQGLIRLAKKNGERLGFLA
ncbi:hypothetical protein GH714_021668 [Hevea brasiliensis]|uniref:Uncharacterized protein n=1 Tax=Hevea brasiliensis TaxID=3981 RepID=A0A6A6MNU5_HEVBR|nr:hypothetical protein GH714_021668 [Hevea brasiliensis]